MGEEEKKYEITENEKKILQMVGTVGAGNAAIALSRMTGTNVSMNVTSTALTKIEDSSKLVEPPAEAYILFYSPLLGISPGNILVIMPTENAILLVDMLAKREHGTTKFLDEMGESMTKETINILGNAYLTALNDFLGITLFPTIPKIKVISLHRGEDIDTLVRGGLATVVRGDIGEEARHVLAINAELIMNEKLMGTLILIVGFKTVGSMLKTVREMLGK